MDANPIILEGPHVRLEPLSLAHRAGLVAAANDGELWNSAVTIVPSSHTIDRYLQDALYSQAQGRELPFVISDKSSNKIAGTTRYYNLNRQHRNVAIGYTWLSASSQRTAVNTETKLLMLTHAFETWQCLRIEFVTDILNQQSRSALLRLGATQEGILRNHMLMPGGRVRDSACFSIILAEWLEIKARLLSRLRQREEGDA